MALIQCPECGKQISDRASSCPNCGFPVNQIHQGEAVQQKPNFANQKQEAHQAYAAPINNQQPVQLGICPCCGQKSDSIKNFVIVSKIVNRLVTYSLWRENVVCCPDCIRKKVLSNIFNLEHVVQGNLLWLGFEVPAGIITCFLASKKGHSPSIVIDKEGKVSVKK